MGRAPSRGSTEAGEGLWLYFKVFLLLFPLPPQAARTSAGSEIRSLPCWVVSACGLSLLFKALKCLQGDYLQGFSLPRIAHLLQLCTYLPNCTLSLTPPTKTLCLLTASGYAGYLPHWPQSSPIPRRNRPSPPHTGDEIRFLLQAGTLSLKGCHTGQKNKYFVSSFTWHWVISQSFR